MILKLSFLLLYAEMTVPQAGRHHVLKLGLCDDLYRQANHGINPSARAIQHIRKQWLSEHHGGLDNLSMADSINRYAANNPDVTILQSIDETRFSAVLVTLFMRRVHTNFREAGEIVFVDATGCIDQLNTSLIPFLCAGPAGAAPLALLFTSSGEVTLKKGEPVIFLCRPIIDLKIFRSMYFYCVPKRERKELQKSDEN